MYGEQSAAYNHLYLRRRLRLSDHSLLRHFVPVSLLILNHACTIALYVKHGYDGDMEMGHHKNKTFFKFIGYSERKVCKNDEDKLIALVSDRCS